MYNNGRNESLVKEKETASKEALLHENNIKKNWEQLMSFSKRQDAPAKEALKAYTAPTVKYHMTTVVEEKNETVNENVDLKPTSTTMQFEKSEQNDIYQEIRPQTSKKEDKDYKINTKGKLLIAVYALVVVTIFSLIILNSRMLRNLDNSIDNYSAQVLELTEQRNEVYNELNEVMSDDVIIEKATEMGMEKA